MYSYPRTAAASAICSIEPDPSLHSVCSCKSPLMSLNQEGFLARIARACVSVKKPFRISGGCGTAGESAIQRRISLSIDPHLTISLRIGFPASAEPLLRAKERLVVLRVAERVATVAFHSLPQSPEVRQYWN